VDCFRHGVCIVIRKKNTTELLVCHRKNCHPDTGWQFPQGGINEAADLVEEMKRELREEIGIYTVSIITILPLYYSYTFPEAIRIAHPGFIGQRHRWILAEWDGDDSNISFDYVPAEFDAYRWVSAREAVQNIVDFKRPVYEKALRDLGML
jgi:putative (di)nucleoside polyphosphate hydrolase